MILRKNLTAREVGSLIIETRTKGPCPRILNVTREVDEFNIQEIEREKSRNDEETEKNRDGERGAVAETPFSFFTQL